VAGKLHVGDKIVAVDDTLLYFKRFVDTIDGSGKHKLRIARLRSAVDNGQKKGQLKKDAKRRNSSGLGIPLVPQKNTGMPRAGAAPALREVRLNKETDETKIGAVFHRSDDAFDKSFFNVEGSSVQPIIKKVDPGSMAETGGLVPGDVVLSVNGISGLSNFQVRRVKGVRWK
jgi:C-terminal processing protease CtpA/Prc